MASRTVTQIKQTLFQLAGERCFVDPITGVGPTSERALTGLLGLYAQRQAIRWDAVPVYSPEEQLCYTAHASELISRPGTFVTEYLLLHRNPEEEGVWGWMPADLLYLADDSSGLVMFENKVGSDFQYESAPATSQLGRQIDYLCRAPIPAVRTRNLVLLTGREFVERGWYHGELAQALAYGDRRQKIGTAGLMFWEDILAALKV
jgi:hypothetical protein